MLKITYIVSLIRSQITINLNIVYIWFKSNLDQVNSEGPTRRHWRMRSGPALVHMFYVTPTTAASYLVLSFFERSCPRKDHPHLRPGLVVSQLPN